MNKYDEFKSAIDEADETMRVLDLMAYRLAQMLVGRLRKIGNHNYPNPTLCALKKELSNYNMTTGKWKH